MEARVLDIDPFALTTLDFLQDILGDYHPREFAVELWDGTRWAPEPGVPEKTTLVLNHSGALRRMFWPPTSLSIGEAYIYGDFDIEGDIEHVFAVGEYLLTQGLAVRRALRKARQLLSLPANGCARDGRAADLAGSQHCQDRDRAAVTYHYDVSNDFYSLWLDRRMVYSCGYFAHEGEDLETAQERKLDYICRKLRIRPGERLLDLGCGWGGLIIHAAKHYGADATGITLSQPQAELANARIDREGLAGRCRAYVMDYRDVEAWSSVDKLVSVGMFEHVGAAKLPDYFERAFKLLKPGGVFLNHGIAQGIGGPKARPVPLIERGPNFIDKYVFPDGELVPIETTLGTAAESGFEVRDVESLREHYALTLRRWVDNLEANADEARQATDDVTYRIWRLFMSASAHGFTTGELSVFQALLVKPVSGASGLPLTRTDWYR